MSELNRDLIKKRLEQLACEDCITGVTIKGHSVRHLLWDVISLIYKQETEYNELYELCESYRSELGEVREAFVEAYKDKKGYQQGAKDIAEKIKKYYWFLGSMTNPCIMEYYINQLLKDMTGDEGG